MELSLHRHPRCLHLGASIRKIYITYRYAELSRPSARHRPSGLPFEMTIAHLSSQQITITVMNACFSLRSGGAVGPPPPCSPPGAVLWKGLTAISLQGGFIKPPKFFANPQDIIDPEPHRQRGWTFFCSTKNIYWSSTYNIHVNYWMCFYLLSTVFPLHSFQTPKLLVSLMLFCVFASLRTSGFTEVHVDVLQKVSALSADAKKAFTRD